MYKIFYWMMVIGYLMVSVQVIGWRMKLIGLLLTIVNGLLFWR